MLFLVFILMLVALFAVMISFPDETGHTPPMNAFERRSANVGVVLIVLAAVVTFVGSL